jgi:hypothetical protein
VSDDLYLFGRPTKGRGAIHIEIVKRSAYVTGTGAWGIAEMLDLPRMKCPFRKTLMIPANRVDDLVAFIEARTNRVVTIEAAAA